ncbi:transposase, partial [Candidatus Uhrbacteria bacterium]|nr:transposase [Candidatus Uhrbacteria bacterium]
MEFSKQPLCVYYARYHLVFVTKYRRKVLKHGMGAFALAVMRTVTRQYPDIHILEAN